MQREWTNTVFVSNTITHDRAALYTELKKKSRCCLFFLSYFYISLSHMLVLTPYAVQVAVMLNEFGYLYTLTRDVFIRACHECDQKKKSTIEDDFCDFIVQPWPFCCPRITRFYFWWHLNKSSGHISTERSYRNTQSQHEIKANTVCVTYTLHCDIITFSDLNGVK